MSPFDPSELLEVPGRPVGDDAVLGRIVRRHRQRRARRLALGGLACALALAGGAVAAVSSGAGPPAGRSSAAPPRSTPRPTAGLPGGLRWLVPRSDTAGFAAALPTDDLVAGANLPLLGRLDRLFARTAGGTSVRAYGGTWKGREAPFGFTVTAGPAAGSTAAATTSGSRAGHPGCRVGRGLLVELSDRDFAGSFVVPLPGRAARGGLLVLGLWRLGVAEHAPIDVAVLSVRAGTARLEAVFPGGGHASMTTTGGTAVVAARVPRRSGAVRLLVTVHGITHGVVVAGTGAVAEPVGACTAEPVRTGG